MCSHTLTRTHHTHTPHTHSSPHTFALSLCHSLTPLRPLRPFTADPRPFTYIRSNTYAPNVPLPKPPKLLLEGTAAATAAADRIRAAAAAGSSSGCGQWVHGGAPLWSKEAVIVKKSEVVGEEEEEEEEEEVVGSGAAAAAGAARSAPHKLLARLNGGHLPYTYLGGKKVREGVWVGVGEGGIECGGMWLCWCLWGMGCVARADASRGRMHETGVAA